MQHELYPYPLLLPLADAPERRSLRRGAPGATGQLHRHTDLRGTHLQAPAAGQHAGGAQAAINWFCNRQCALAYC